MQFFFLVFRSLQASQSLIAVLAVVVHRVSAALQRERSMSKDIAELVRYDGAPAATPCSMAAMVAK